MKSLLPGRMLSGLALSALFLFAQKPDAPALLKLARKPQSPEFQKALEAFFTPQQLEKGEAFVTWGPEALFAMKTAKLATVSIDDGAPQAAKKAGAYAIATAKLAPYTSHTYAFFVEGKRAGGRLDVPVFGPEAYPVAGVAEGKLSEKIVHTSKIYDGMKSDYWIYASPGVDAGIAAPVMIWQDGEKYASRAANNRLLIQLDNLVAQKRIPAMVHVFISPGLIGERRMRSVEYDTYNDTYTKYLLQEILVEVAAKYKLRADGYSRAIAGESSGGICAFNAAWWRPEEFGRVYSRIGSFTSIQWKPGELDGGNIYPFAIRKQPKRNIRVYLSDGSEDLENNHGSWPLQNIQMANSLKMKEYDFKFVWGSGPHSTAQGNAEAPLALEWLWRGYDAAKTSETFTMDPAEKNEPFYRVKVLNRK